MSKAYACMYESIEEGGHMTDFPSYLDRKHPPKGGEGRGLTYSSF